MIGRVALCAVVCVLLNVALLVIPAQAPQQKEWRLVIDDEFSGETKLNESIWGHGTQPWGVENSNACTLVRAEDTYFNEAGLVNRTTAGNYKGATGATYHYSDGEVWIRPGYWMTYGYVEMKAQYPNEQGAWPAFWMLRKGWPPEFDIAEYRGAPKGYMTLAFDNTARKWDTSTIPDTGSTFTGWHTYGLDWEPGELTYYMDGKALKTHTGPDVPATAMYVILSGGVDCASAGGTGFPNDFSIAYFRWYQQPASSKPDAPTELSAKPQEGAVALAWNAPGGSPEGYRVKRATSPGGPYVAIASIPRPVPTTFTDQSVHAGQRYSYVVSATNSYGEGPNSAEVALPVTSSSPLAEER